VTAARDWPPGGYEETECAEEKKNLKKESVPKNLKYDWATNLAFPFFKGDFRPLADGLEQWALDRDPHNACDWKIKSYLGKGNPVYWLSLFLRVFPFMNTNPDESRTIGNVDPARGPFATRGPSARPYGTTHELYSLTPRCNPNLRECDRGSFAEIPLPYDEVLGGKASCPIAKGWLFGIREFAQKYRQSLGAHGMRWDSDDLKSGGPALAFVHGFRYKAIPAVTRANDPFWNMRAYDTVLVEHTGFTLTSFICAMNQLVMDDPTKLPAPDQPPTSANDMPQAK